MIIILIVILDLYIVQAQKWGKNGLKGDRGILGGVRRTRPLFQLLWYCIFQCQENNEIFMQTLKLNKAALEQLL